VKLLPSLLFLIFCISIGYAQTPIPTGNPDTVTSFLSKQKEIIEILVNQRAKLKEIDFQIDNCQKNANRVLGQVKFATQIPFIRDSALKATLALRTKSKEYFSQFCELALESNLHSRDIASIYTRYGELKKLPNIDDSLAEFIKEHRVNIFLTEGLAKKFDNLFNDLEFLLISKLN